MNRGGTTRLEALDKENVAPDDLRRKEPTNATMMLTREDVNLVATHLAVVIYNQRNLELLHDFLMFSYECGKWNACLECIKSSEATTNGSVVERSYTGVEKNA